LIYRKLLRLGFAVANAIAIKSPKNYPAGLISTHANLGSIAQFEREIMLERQREGIANAKGEGKYKGRAPTARAKASEVQELRRARKGPSEIANQVGISRASVYRIIVLAIPVRAKGDRKSRADCYRVPADAEGRELQS
jgi:hypothetical protein